MRDIFNANIPIQLKREVFDRCLLSVMIYSAETLTLTKRTAEKLKVTLKRMGRSMLDLTLMNRERTEGMSTYWSGWTLYNELPRADTLSRKSPPTRWTDDLRTVTTNWIATTKNRENWRRPTKGPKKT
ncbi:hypothetical protein Trydic_g4758 [Trypoxylus dichotomus]